MKIAHTKTTLSRADFISNLSKQGYEKIGSGCYATVFASPSKRTVIKVCNGIDPAYCKFLGIFDKDDRCTLFPKIETATLMHGGRGKKTYLVVELERLIAYYDLNPHYRLLAMQAAGVTSIYDLGSRDVEQTIMQAKHPMIKNGLKRMRDMFKDESVDSDIHAGNVMFREVGKKLYQLVVTDSVVS